jgi:hypothetical protein
MKKLCEEAGWGFTTTKEAKIKVATLFFLNLLEVLGWQF